MTNGPGDAAGPLLPSPAAAVGEAAGEMAARARGFLPAARRFVSRVTYDSCYFASYGVTFPTVFLVNVIPGGLPLAAGLADGARAARDYVRGTRSRSEKNLPNLQESSDLTPGAMPANVTHVSDESNEITEDKQDRTVETKVRKQGRARERMTGPARRQAKPPGKRRKPEQ